MSTPWRIPELQGRLSKMRWESRGENLNLLDNICHSHHTFPVPHQNYHGHLGCHSHPQLLGERLDVLGSLENAGIDWLVFRSKDWTLLKSQLRMKIMKWKTWCLLFRILHLLALPDVCAVLQVSFLSCQTCIYQHESAANRLLEFDGNTKTSRAQQNSISNIFIDKLSEVKSRCVSSGLHGIVPNYGGDCWGGKRQGWEELRRTPMRRIEGRGPTGRRKREMGISWRLRQNSCGSWGQPGRRQSVKLPELRWVPPSKS